MSEAQTIFRVASRHKPYSQLGNAMIRDNNLSLEARGALCFILSFPENWTFDLAWLMRSCAIGRDKARRIINEYVANNYCCRQRDRNSNGQLGAYEYVFTDEPTLFEPEPEKASLDTTDALPVAGEPAPVNPTTITKNDLPKENPKAAARVTKSRKGKAAMDIDPITGIAAAALAQGLELAPGWDKEVLLEAFLGMPEANNPDAAWVGFCRNKGANPDVEARFRSSVPRAVIERETPKMLERKPTRIGPRHPMWLTWLDHLRARLERELVEKIERAGGMIAPSYGPWPECPLPEPHKAEPHKAEPPKAEPADAQ